MNVAYVALISSVLRENFQWAAEALPLSCGDLFHASAASFQAAAGNIPMGCGNFFQWTADFGSSETRDSSQLRTSKVSNGS
jgi:hypothetical protein